MLRATLRFGWFAVLYGNYSGTPGMHDRRDARARLLFARKLNAAQARAAAGHTAGPYTVRTNDQLQIRSTTSRRSPAIMSSIARASSRSPLRGASKCQRVNC